MRTKGFWWKWMFLNLMKNEKERFPMKFDEKWYEQREIKIEGFNLKRNEKEIDLDNIFIFYFHIFNSPQLAQHSSDRSVECIWNENDKESNGRKEREKEEKHKLEFLSLFNLIRNKWSTFKLLKFFKSTFYILKVKFSHLCYYIKNDQRLKRSSK